MGLSFQLNFPDVGNYVIQRSNWPTSCISEAMNSSKAGKNFSGICVLSLTDFQESLAQSELDLDLTTTWWYLIGYHIDSWVLHSQLVVNHAQSMCMAMQRRKGRLVGKSVPSRFRLDSNSTITQACLVWAQCQTAHSVSSTSQQIGASLLILHKRHPSAIHGSEALFYSLSGMLQRNTTPPSTVPLTHPCHHCIPSLFLMMGTSIWIFSPTLQMQWTFLTKTGQMAHKQIFSPLWPRLQLSWLH